VAWLGSDNSQWHSVLGQDGLTLSAVVRFAFRWYFSLKLRPQLTPRRSLSFFRREVAGSIEGQVDNWRIHSFCPLSMHG
jgi:hypothetical protein